MRHLPLAVFGLLSILALAACSPSGIDMSTPVSESGSAARAQGGSGYRTNPQPKQAYRVTMTIAGAPGPFASMRALAQYDVVNKECLRPPKDNPGGHTSPVPTDDIEIPLTRISDNEYSGIVYADYMQDEDYNGRGVCRWKLIQFRVHMKATEGPGEAQLIPSIPDEKLLAEQPEVVYFNKISYSEHNNEYEPIDFGDKRSRFGPSIKDSDLFTITFTSSKEARP